MTLHATQPAASKPPSHPHPTSPNNHPHQPSGAVAPTGRSQVIGTALALLLLTGGGVPLWAGVLLAAAGAYTMLFLERLGARWLELLFQALVAGTCKHAMYLRGNNSFFWALARACVLCWAAWAGGCADAAEGGVRPMSWGTQTRCRRRPLKPHCPARAFASTCTHATAHSTPKTPCHCPTRSQ